MNSLLVSSVVLFPLWLQMWDRGPLTASDMNPKAPNALTAVQASSLRTVYPGLSSNEAGLLAARLAKSGVPEAGKMLAEWLAAEQEPQTQAALLRQLWRKEGRDLMGKAGVPLPLERLKELARVDSPACVEAAALYAVQKGGDGSLLKACLASPSADVQRRVWELVAAEPAVRGGVTVADCLQERGNASVAVQAAALKAAIALADGNEAPLAEWLDAASRPEASALLRVAAAQCATEAVLLRLAQDASPAVRIAVYYPKRKVYPKALLQMAPDALGAIREEQLWMLMRAGGQCPSDLIAKRLKAGLEDAAPTVRLTAATILADGGNLTSEQRLAVQAAALSSPKAETRLAVFESEPKLLERVRELAGGEELPENRVAAIRHYVKLAKPGNPADLELLVAATASRSPRVRAAAAEALGRLQVPGCEPTLLKLVRSDKSGDVRAAAYLAMGCYPRPVFVKDLADCFVKRKRDDDLLSRTYAAWAAGRHAACGADERALAQLAERLHVHCTKAVIPAEMGPVFDQFEVLVNAMVSLAKLRKAHGGSEAIREAADSVLRVYNDPEPPTNYGKGEPPPCSAMMASVSHQCQQWLEGKEPTAEEIPPQALSFDVSALKE